MNNKLPESHYTIKDAFLAAEAYGAAFDVLYDISKNDTNCLKKLRADIIQNFVWDIIDKRLYELEETASQNENPTSSPDSTTEKSPV